MNEPTGQGMHYEADPQYDRIPPYDPRSGDHYWITLAAFHVEPSTWEVGQQQHLDRENLVQIAAAGCYYCERAWSALLARRRCPGEPR